MNKIEWKSEYSVGVQRLDKQHQKIIKIINILIENQNIFNDAEATEAIFLELTNYVSEHFLLEEQLLEENGYSNLIEHSEKHTAYSEQIANFCVDVIQKKCKPDQLLYFLRKWWVDHILYEDMKYKHFFKIKNIM